MAKQVDDAQCSNDTRPQARKVCKIQDCETRLYPIRQGLEYYWRISMWTPVSLLLSLLLLSYWSGNQNNSFFILYVLLFLSCSVLSLAERNLAHNIATLSAFS